MEPKIIKNTVTIPTALIINALIIASAVLWGAHTISGAGPTASAQQQTQETQAQAAPEQTVDVSKVNTSGEPFIGDPNAPLTMAYWSDYQCPFCKQFETTVLPTLIDSYVKTGKLKIVFKDYQFLGNDSTTGGEYARAIWDLYPTQFFAWREAMYKAQDQEGDQGFGNAASIDQLISSIPGIDDAKVKAAIVANKTKYDAAMAADEQEGMSFGIQGTPGFIIGSRSIDGAVPLSQFTAAIDSQLK